ncbi:unnamed protein product [Toxocara canis]|uniref:Trm112 family protein n=1 Tax=Toxocara canis TaxID=6265 RepID=A0A183U8I8_TOXCA|nr:unnamed protein product [Toxocara canis]
MPDLDILKCPKCSDRLEPLELEMFEEDGKRYQRIAWMCRGIAKQVSFLLHSHPRVACV